MKRILFKEKGWRITTASWCPHAYVEHLDCPNTSTRAMFFPRTWEERDTYPTYNRDRTCFFCDSGYPDFITNMLVFTRWCNK